MANLALHKHVVGSCHFFHIHFLREFSNWGSGARWCDTLNIIYTAPRLQIHIPLRPLILLCQAHFRLHRLNPSISKICSLEIRAHLAVSRQPRTSSQFPFFEKINCRGIPRCTVLCIISNIEKRGQRRRCLRVVTHSGQIQMRSQSTDRLSVFEFTFAHWPFPYR